MIKNREKHYVFNYAQLMAEWDWECNNRLNLDPRKISCKSSKKAYWIGLCNHKWYSTIYHRYMGRGCPVCAGNVVLQGFNDLLTVNPVLAREWHPTSNVLVKPTMVSSGSKKKVWWLGKCGHSWEATVNSRNDGSGCPYCTNKKLFAGYNDLKTMAPALSTEWHPIHNGNCTSSMVFSGSEKKVWWLGKCGHEWKASIKSRHYGNGCPICAKQKQSSFPEQAIFFYVKQMFEDAENSYTGIFSNKMELDIYIPSVSIGIEYDGKAFHDIAGALAKEKEKYDICRANGVKLIRIREFINGNNEEICDEIILISHHPTSEEINNAILLLLQLLNENSDIMIDVEHDAMQIMMQYISAMKMNTLAVECPELAREWHPCKNGTLLPSMFSKASGQKVWWQCSNGHEWKTAINTRYKGNNCPFCSGKKLLIGYNDLKTVNPSLSSEWHYEKNGCLLPSMVQSMSGIKVWWRCHNGHEWMASVPHRSKGSGCPYCSGRIPVEGETDFSTLYPKLAQKWHPFKNGALLPSMVTRASEKKVWWLGECSHEWQRTVKTMVLSSACPICINRQVLAGFNDLSTVDRNLAAEWHPSKNGSLKPTMFTYKSGKKVWWICDRGHEWKARIADRSSGSRCPICVR